MSSVYPAIPDPTPTVESLAETVRVMKVAVDLLTGQRTGGTAAHTFTQETTPTALTTGDLWIVPSTGVVSYWDGSSWLVVSPASTAATSTASTPASGTTSIPLFGAYASVAQAVSSGVWTQIAFGTEEFDTNNDFALSAFTPTVAGYYQLNANVCWSGGSNETALALYKNGSVFKLGADADYGYSVGVSTIVYANGTTDTFTIYGYTASSQNVSAGQQNTYFNGALAGAA